MKLKHELTYAPGTWAAFSRCPREFYLRKIRFWRGWEAKAPREKKIAYACTKMGNGWTLVGNAVHEVIRQVILYGRLDREGAVERYKEMVRSGWGQSRREEWRGDPKGSEMLFGHYYREALTDDYARVEIEKAAPRGKVCIENFFDNEEQFGDYHDLVGGAAEVVSSEDWKTFDVVPGISSRIRFDLALKGERGGEPAVEVTDWKTGKPKAEHHAEQGIHYAIAATQLWEVPLERVALRFGYLGVEDGVLTLDTYTPEQVTEYQERVERRFEELSQRWALWEEHGDTEEGGLKHFPRVEDKRTCQRCDMFHACWGHKDLSRVREIAEPVQGRFL